MTLDDQLNSAEQLQQLEIGNVERVIGQIEASKHRTARLAAEADLKINGATDVYEYLVREKLPRILENIQTMSGQIFDLNDFDVRYDFSNGCLSPWKRGRYYTGDTELRLSLKSEENFNSLTLMRRDTEWEYSLPLVFNEGNLFVQGVKRVKKGFLKRLNHFFQDDSEVEVEVLRTPYEFTEHFLDLVLPEVKLNGTSMYTEVPLLLNYIPETISKVYEWRRQTQEERLVEIPPNINGQNERLKTLDVSDFSE